MKVKWLIRIQLFATPWTAASVHGSSVHGIFKARVLEWVSISFSRGSSQPRDRTWVSHVVGRRSYRLSHHGSQIICMQNRILEHLITFKVFCQVCVIVNV